MLELVHASSDQPGRQRLDARGCWWACCATNACTYRPPQSAPKKKLTPEEAKAAAAELIKRWVAGGPVRPAFTGADVATCGRHVAQVSWPSPCHHMGWQHGSRCKIIATPAACSWHGLWPLHSCAGRASGVSATRRKRSGCGSRSAFGEGRAWASLLGGQVACHPLLAVR